MIQSNHPFSSFLRAGRPARSNYHYKVTQVMPNQCSYETNVEQFFTEVMRRLKKKGWQLRWMESDAYCWRGRKIIDICPMDSEATCKQMLLHEIAHIDIVEIGNQHTVRFFERVSELVQKCLGQEIDKYQQKMRGIYLS